MGKIILNTIFVTILYMQTFSFWMETFFFSIVAQTVQDDAKGLKKVPKPNLIARQKEKNERET